MIKRLARMLCALCFLVLAGPPPTRAAPVITLVPMPTTINPPANLSIDVDISGLRSGGQNIILGAFDLTINFDPDVLEFLQIGSHFGTGLGDPGDPLQTAVGGDLSPGSFRFFEVSLLDASTLEALQSDSFSLATLLFYAPGTSPSPPFTDLTLSPACSSSSTPPGCSILSDADGNDINNFGIVNARVDIPEPSTILLLLVALAGAICCIQRTVFTRFRGTIAARCLLRSSIVIAFWVTFMMSEAAQAQTTYQIPLKSGTIVLQKTQFPAAAPRVAVPATSQYMIIQFERNLRSSDIDGLRMTGISPLTLVFANAWLCNVRFGALTASAAATYGIAAAAQWLPDHKIEPRLRQGQIDDWAKTANGDVKLLVKFFEDVDSDTAKAVLRSYSSSPRFFGAPNTWAIETPPSAIQTLMNEPLVQSIEQGPRPFEPTNDASRAILNVDAVQLADLSKTPPVYRGLSGSGVNIQVSEYVSTNHPDFLSHDAAGNPTTSRFLNPLPSAQTGSPHGTHVAGTIGGNGWASDKGINGGTPYQWRGMAPESTLISGDGYGTYPVHVSNHSYVLSYGQYESGVQQVDRDIRGADGLAFQRPHVWAAANQGITAQYGSETGYYSVYAPSKNALVVGAVNSNDGSLASFSSLGPTFDGRIKPDVVSPGCTNTISPDFGYDQLMTMQIDYMRIYDGATLVKGWEFDTPSDFGGWFDTFNVDGYGYGPSNLQNWEISNDLLSFQAKPFVPGYMWTDQVTIPPTDHQIIEIRYRGLIGNATPFIAPSHLYWKISPYTHQYVDGQIFGQPLYFDNQFHVVDYPVGALGKQVTNFDPETPTGLNGWIGNQIYSLRFDPVFPGRGVISTAALDSSYKDDCGTSMAAPAIAGVVALMLQEFHDLWGDNLDDAPPLPSTLKAILIETATDLVHEKADPRDPNNPDTNSPVLYYVGPDFASGYGLVDAQAATDLIGVADAGLSARNCQAGALICESSIGVSERGVFSFFVPGGLGDLKVTLAWDDVEGSTSTSDTTPKLVNDIDLVLFDPLGKPHYAWKLDPLCHGQSGCTRDHINANDVMPAYQGRDHLNNVEQVEVSGALPGQWRAIVEGFNIQDVVSGKQSYSLVTTYPLRKVSGLSPGDLNGDGCVDRTDLNLLLDDVRASGPHNGSYDLNGDGHTDIADARKLVTLFTNPGGVPCH